MVAVFCALMLVGCGKPAKTGYEIRISDGWFSSYYDCETYTKKERILKCFNIEGVLIRELDMPVDMRVYITKYGLK